MKTFLWIAAVAFALLPSFTYAQAAPTGSFTLATQINADGTLTPTLTWSTTPAATSCVASGDSAWAGPKAASGTQVLEPFPASTPKAYALLCTWPEQTQAFLTWTPPTENTDDTPLTNLAGYRVHWGTTQMSLTNVAQLPDPSAVSYIVSDLAPGTWFFGVRAYTSQGAESDLSNIVSRTMTDPVEWSQSTGIKVPKAPVLE